MQRNQKHAAARLEPSTRQLKVGELFLHHLADLFRTIFEHDPILSKTPITISEVRLTPDLRNARVFVMPLGGQGDTKIIVKQLNQEAKRIRHFLAPRLTMKFLPVLHFELDTTFDYAAKISTLLAHHAD